MQKLNHVYSGLLVIALTLTSTLLRAQADVKVDVTKTSSSTTWYTNPIVWIVGAAVFILLIIALVRGGGRKD
jgi:hypothetical protein